MTAEVETTIHPLSASADGKRNAFSRRCEVLGQTMNYAACLWRNGVLERDDIKAPADWEPCRNAMRCGTCNSANMRREEVLKGHSIYFKDRSVLASIKDAARTWLGMDYFTKKPGTAGSVTILLGTRRTSTPAAPAPAPKPKRDVFDAMGDMGSYADAITAAASSAPVSAPRIEVPPTPSPAPAASPKPAMLPGESPLAYMRRLKTLNPTV